LHLRDGSGNFGAHEPNEPRMMTPTLRPATPADIAAITAIYRPAVLTGTASFELEPPGEDEMLRRFRAITEAGYPYFVAELDGRVAGYAYVNAYRTRPAYRFTVENSVYIAPDSQGKGIGRALLDRLIATCRDDGLRLMIAVIGDSANFASISLHRRAGFRFCGTIHSVGYKFGRWLDSVLMELPLGEGDTSAPAERPR
jgi:phosphinothricin acetyltransferase